MDMNALLQEYEQNHQSMVCKATHAVGIPLIVISLPMLLVSRRRAMLFFAAGWVLQFAGHAAEGKQPKFFEGAEYLVAGVLWWVDLVLKPLRTLAGGV